MATKRKTSYCDGKAVYFRILRDHVARYDIWGRSMLCVTKSAQEVLREALDNRSLRDQDLAFRLRVIRDRNTGRKRFGLFVDRVQAGDQIVEHNGRKVLVVNDRIATRLDGVELKAVDTLRGRRLRFQRLESRAGRPDDR